MQYHLLDYLRSIEDKRRKEGLRHSMALMLTLIIMSIISGHQGYRGIARFCSSHSKELIEIFKLKHGVPKFGTIRTVILSLDLDKLEKGFRIWMEKELSNRPSEEEEKDPKWYSSDGKCIRATVTDDFNSLQNFTSTVSIFAQRSGLSLAFASTEHKKAYEPEVVRNLIKSLGLSEGIITLDALHCQKKH